ncbi:hypothetical protein MAR_022648 [Mya arenaria]|uniref:Uncharacterized protein n=1 Tax=Mya arenaria TaxID=6604 RepID=A0ABY7DPI2_MYAAR|nr:hypothetical protein MAR_022648 [Mya arenaria]
MHGLEGSSLDANPVLVGIPMTMRDRIVYDDRNLTFKDNKCEDLEHSTVVDSEIGEKEDETLFDMRTFQFNTTST